MSNTPKKLDTCPNCETSLPNLETFCPNCGQKNRETLLPVKAHLEEVFESVFNWDSRILRTLKVMFFKPGLLSKAFNEGKRKSYVPPLRLYLIASLVFFLLFSWSSKNDIELVNHSFEDILNNPNMDTIPLNMGILSLKLTPTEILTVDKFDDVQMDSFLVSKGKNASMLNRLSVRQSIKLIKGDVSGLLKQLTEAGSLAMFFLMPAFAGLLFLIFRKPKRFYVEHLVLSIHLHTLFFLLFAIDILIGQTIMEEFYNFILAILIFIYPILYFKRFYEKGWWKTIGLSLLLGLSYLIILIITLMGIALISLLIF